MRHKGRPQHATGSWRDEPVTQKQIDLIRRLGVFVRADFLTKGEASDLIDRLWDEQPAYGATIARYGS